MTDRKDMAAPDYITFGESLAFDPETGVITWKVGRPKHMAEVGSVAGSVNSKGYLVLGFLGKRYLAHRVAWLLTHKRWPEKFIDHKNGARTDNRIANLREATRAENMRNQPAQKTNTSGYKGIFLKRGRWYAQICGAGRKWSLGTYDTRQEAHAAYRGAALVLHGDYANFLGPIPYVLTTAGKDFAAGRAKAGGA